MGGRKIWASGDILTAADVNDYLMDQSVMVFAGTAARASAIASPSEGMITYRSDSNVVEAYTGAAWQSIGGKILQVVRATDTTNRSTTSTSDVDVTGMTVTITPQKSDSAVLVLAVFGSESGGSSTIHQSIFTVTDSSNNSISGTEAARNGMWGLSASGIQLQNTLVAYATPATTSAVTYKLRFRSQAVTVTTTVLNGSQTGQMFAIEVAA